MFYVFIINHCSQNHRRVSVGRDESTPYDSPLSKASEQASKQVYEHGDSRHTSHLTRHTSSSNPRGAGIKLYTIPVSIRYPPPPPPPPQLAPVFTFNRHIYQYTKQQPKQTPSQNNNNQNESYGLHGVLTAPKKQGWEVVIA